MTTDNVIPLEGFGTKAVRSGLPHDQATGALAENICLSTTFQQPSAGKPTGSYIYSRSSNPNRQSLERSIAILEGAEYALTFSSGLAATSAVLQGLAANSHVLSIASLYGGTHRYFTYLGSSLGIDVTYTNSMEIDAAMLIQDNTTLLWIETPSNPTLFLVDIEAVAKVAHQRGVLVVVDNTFLSPYIQTPLKWGADIVLHSVTKYLNGHSDVLMGALAFNSQKLKEKLSFVQNAAGGVPSPFDCWLAHRGMKTLHLRAATCSTSALAIAHFLESNKYVISVNYPGLSSHPHHHIALKQHRKGFHGGVISFRIKGGQDVALRFCETSTYFTLAESLGGVESLCEIPSVMTHNGMGKEAREVAGVYDDMIRLSVGIEDVEDLIRDLETTLERVMSTSS